MVEVYDVTGIVGSKGECKMAVADGALRHEFGIRSETDANSLVCVFDRGL